MSNYELDKEKELEGRKEVNKNQVLVNGKVIDKLSVVSLLSQWLRETFIFRNNEVYLPVEKTLPINNVDDELTKIESFKASGLHAIEYMVLCILVIGIKIGREMEHNQPTKENEND